MVVSFVFVDYSCSPPQLRRMFLAIYYRKSILDYIYRVAMSWCYITHCSRWFTSQPQHRQGVFEESYFANLGDVGILEGVALMSTPNADKSAWLSPFIDTFLNLDRKFNLSLEEALEVMYPICIVTEPFKFWSIVQDWIKRKELPSSCLTVLLFSEACDRFRCLNSGPCNRLQAFANTPIDFKTLAKALVNLNSIVIKWNRKHLSGGQVAFRDFLYDIRNKVPYAGSLSGQHLAHALVLTGIVHHPFLASMAHVAVGTLTAKRIVAHTGCDLGDCDKIVRSVANSIGQPISIGENVTCEATRTKEAVDLYFPGQSIIRPVKVDGTSGRRAEDWSIIRSFPDGRQSETVPYFNGSMTAVTSRRLCARNILNWWERNPKIPVGSFRTTNGPSGKFRKVFFCGDKRQAMFFRSMFLSARSERDLTKIMSEFDGSIVAANQGKGKSSSKIPTENKESFPPQPEMTEADWGRLVGLVRENYFPLNNNTANFGVAHRVEEIRGMYRPDTSIRMQSGGTANSNHSILIIDEQEVAKRSRKRRRTSQASLPDQLAVVDDASGMRVQPNDAAAGQPIRRQAKKASARRIDLPKDISDVLIASSLKCSWDSSSDTWDSLDFFSAADICVGRFHNLLGHSLTRAKIPCKESLIAGGAQLGYYAVIAGLEDYTVGKPETVYPIASACGEGPLGIFPGVANINSPHLLFRNKNSAIDFLLLSILILEPHGLSWRRKLTHRKFCRRQHGEPRTIIPIAKTRTKQDAKSRPYFCLVKAPKSDKVYAVFRANKLSTLKDSCMAYPFNF